MALEFGVSTINKLSRDGHDNEYVHKTTTYNKGDIISKVTGGVGNSTGSVAGTYKLKLWGQPFDGQADVAGDMSDVGSLSATGTVRAPSFVQDGHFVLDNDNSEVAENYVKIYNTTHYFLGTDALGNVNHDVHIDGDLYVNGDGTFDDINADVIQANSVHTHELTADIAHFFELQIDKIKAVGGTVIVTPANLKVDYVEQLQNGNYRCYQIAEDTVNNTACDDLWDDGDQAICASFNAQEGTTYNVSNKFYWCAVVSHGTMDYNGEHCVYIELSTSDKDSACTVNPEVGDEIAQLGNKTTKARQNAIIISSYKSPDSTVGAPSITQYSGINDYQLSTHKVTVISPDGNIFKGEFHVSSGENIEDIIGGQTPGGDGRNAYIHFAWADDANGTGFTKVKSQADGKVYMGICSNFTESDSTLVFADYTWFRVRGADGADGQDGKDGQNADGSGTNGENACHIDLDNENDSVIATPDGTIVQATLPTTNCLFYDGASVVTMNESNMIVTTKGCTYTKSRYVYMAVNRGWTFKITDVTADVASLTVEYTYNGAKYTAVLNIKKLTGTEKWEIITTPTVVRKKADGTLSANSIKVDVYKTNAQGVRQKDTSITTASHRLRYYIGSSSTAKYLASSGTIESSEWSSAESVTIELYDANNVIADKETVPVVADGSNGKGISSITTYYKAYATQGNYSRSDGGTSSWKEYVSSTEWSKDKPYLYAYQYWAFSDGSETYSNVYLSSVWGKDGKDGGEAGSDGQDGQNGQDAEFYVLVAANRQAIVTKHDKLMLDFAYSVMHIKGDEYTQVSNLQNSGFKLRFRTDKDSTYIENWTYSGATATYTNANYLSDYHRNTNHPLSFKIELCNANNLVLDTDIADVVFEAGAALDIADDIRSSVQDISGNLSTITQRADSIESRVSDVENNYSAINQRIDSITAGVTRAAGTNIMTGVGNAQGWYYMGSDEGSMEFEKDDAFGYYTFIAHNKKYTGTGSYSDACIVSPIIGVEGGADYVLSFWFKADGLAANDWLYYKNNGSTNSTVRSWVQIFGGETEGACTFGNSSLVNLPTTVIYANNEEKVYREQGYYRYSIKFKAFQHNNTTAANYIKLVFYNRQYSGGTSASNVYIRNVQVERGDECTGFALSKAYSESQMKMTADNLTLEVKDKLNRAGIDIDSQTITLQANTTKILGDLGLYDTDNGLIVYDTDGTPRVNILPSKIGLLKDFKAGSVAYYHPVGRKTNSGEVAYDVTTDRCDIGKFDGGSTVTLDTWQIYFHAYKQDEQSVYPTTSNIKLKVTIKRDGNSTAIKTQEYTATKVQYSQYKVTSALTFTAPTTDAYYITCQVTGTEKPPKGYTQVLNVNCRVTGVISGMTTMGLDGFYCNPGTNKLAWFGSDGMNLQWMNSSSNKPSGIKFCDDGPQICCGMGYRTSAMDSQDMAPVYLPMWNYVPLCQVGRDTTRTWTYKNIAILNEYKYCYQIDPYKDAGIIEVYAPPYNSRNEVQEAWIVLPPTPYIGANGIKQALPAGYQVTIITSCHTSNGATHWNTYVIPDRSTSNSWKDDDNGRPAGIIDSNRNLNVFSDLNSTMARDTFIWDGYFWYQMHDPQ